MKAHKNNMHSKNNIKTHCFSIHTSAGVFETKEEIERFTDSFRHVLKSLCEKKHANILCYIGISNTKKDNIIRTARGSKRIDETAIEDWHLHIVALAEKESTMLKEIKYYFYTTNTIQDYRKLNPSKKGFLTKTIHTAKYLKNSINYTVGQSYKFRIVNTCTLEFAQKYAGTFVSLIERKEKSIGNSKVVFPEYVNVTLGTDNSIFDFSSAKNSDNICASVNEVWNVEINSQPLFSDTEYNENVLILDEKGLILHKIAPNLTIFSPKYHHLTASKITQKKCNVNIRIECILKIR